MAIPNKLILVSVVLGPLIFFGGATIAQTTADEFVALGMVELKANRLDAARAIFERCIAQFKPAPWDCTLRRAIILFTTDGRKDEAIRDLDTAASVWKADKAVQYSLGRAYTSFDKLPESILAYSRAIALDPKFKNAYISRAYAYHKNGQLAEAIADATSAIRLDPNDAKAFDLRGTFYAYRFEYANAIADLSKAISLDAKLAMPYVTRGNMNALQGKYELALPDFTKAIELDPKMDIAYKARAASLCNMGKKDLANADEKKVLDLGGKVEQPCRF